MPPDGSFFTQVFSLSPRLWALPIIHGSGNMAQIVREVMVSHQFDCLAVPLPPSLEDAVGQAVDALPLISVVALTEEDDDQTERCSYVPIDPCQPVIMGIRAARSEGTPCVFVDQDVARFEPVPWTGPDPYALRTLSIEAFAASTLPFLPVPRVDSPRWSRIAWMAFRLHELELEYRRILFLCPLIDWPWLRLAYTQRLPYTNPDPSPSLPAWWRLEPSSLYFVLCELPFVTGVYEQRRQEARSDRDVSVDGIKEMMLESRKRWLAARGATTAQEADWVTPQLLQRYLQYVRNLALLESRLTPDLYTLVRAGQQMAGDDFALTLLETAKSYPFQSGMSPMAGQATIAMGLGELQDPDGHIVQAINRLEGAPLVWRNLTLRPRPPAPQQRTWAYRWNPYRQCSWPPEDQRIETFAAHVRKQSRTLIGAELARVQPFHASLEDGIDMRETLRKWATTPTRSLWDLQVKVIPPARGTIEVLVFFFEVPADPQIYSWRTTWYAEHLEESTLSFYATPFSANLVGPGIGQARYGGAMFLFPPRPIPDVWENPAFDFARSLEERLLAGACAHSQESYVTVVSPVPLKAGWRHIARRYGRKLVPLPLHRFSGQTIARLRQFHVLNGHEIRSYAARFIRE